jgi:hypothetical protein
MNESGMYTLDVRNGKVEKFFRTSDIEEKYYGEIFKSDELDSVSVWPGHPQWSPDRSRIIFMTTAVGPETGQRTMMFWANRDGSDVRKIRNGRAAHFKWYSDSSSFYGYQGGRMCRWDLTNKLLELMHHGDINGHGELTEDGVYIIADTYDQNCLKLYRRGARTPVFELPLRRPVNSHIHPSWSRDGKRVFFNAGHKSGTQVFMLDVSSLMKENTG